MRHLTLSVLSVLAAALLGGPTAPLRVPSPRDDMVVKHKWDVIPDNWLILGPPRDDTTIDIHIALHPEHKNALADVLYEVSQPGHPKYGAHLSREQVAELVAPHPDTLELVTSWLEYHGVPPSSIFLTHGGGWLTVTDVPVSQANELLGASYQFYYHAGRNDTILRTAGYALPAALHVHVQTIVPTTAFMPTRLLQQTPRRSGDATVQNATSGKDVKMLSGRQEGAIEPSVLLSLYKIGTYVPPPGANSRLGIVGSDNEFPNLGDQSLFMQRFRSDAPAETIIFEPILPNVRKGYSNKRANMFAQFAAAITHSIPITFYRDTGKQLKAKGKGNLGNQPVQPGSDDAIHQWLKYTVDQQSNPNTIALISEGISETNLPWEYMKVVCDLFEGLGARGSTVLVPSGDNGVGSSATGSFRVNFPASCPHVTSVGGTTGNPEVASSFSGGGFSRFFSVESYQKNYADDYVSDLKDDYHGRYVPGGRGVPDIAAQAQKYTFIYNSKEKEMESTACSTSTVAAIFSLLNDYRLSQGITPLGFLNPWLYGIGSIGFNDITVGNNPGARSNGFFAREGWDPVTGLGTPDFSLLFNLISPTFVQPTQPVQPERRNQSFHDQQHPRL